jgi:hypothetical protein
LRGLKKTAERDPETVIIPAAGRVRPIDRIRRVRSGET